MSRPCLLDALGAVPDPRSRKGRTYPWTPILALLVVVSRRAFAGRHERAASDLRPVGALAT